VSFTVRTDHLFFAGLRDAGFSHAVSTRSWGSLNPFVGYNFLSRLEANLEAGPGGLVDRLVVPEEVHSSSVHACVSSDGGSIRLGVDALVAASSHIIALVFVADCIPILLADPDTGAVAVAHAGRRGLLSGIVGATVATMVSNFGATAARLLVGIGPALRVCCHEIREDIFFELENADWMRFVQERDNRYYLDLVGGCRDALLAAGVAHTNIEDSNICTYCDPRFFSARRRSSAEEKGASFAAMISPR
jgi:purine-nucleoside/S-methyl-5'-thioadenosine phosphorylase / adenosine deaminase